MEKQKYLFVLYARDDLDRALPIVEAIRKELEHRQVPVQVWMDISNLRPGENWNLTIAEALESSVAFLYFISPRSVKSDSIHSQLRAATNRGETRVVPVFLDSVQELPHEWMERNAFDLSGDPTQKQIRSAAIEIAQTVATFLISNPTPPPGLLKKAIVIAADLAQKIRSADVPADQSQRPRSVFVVHGHSDPAVAKLEGLLKSVDVEPVVLSRSTEATQSLFQEFLAVASKASFAVVVLSSDDYGASRRQYESEGVGHHALQFRARQNVLLELGFFYGKLGWENVFVVQEEPGRVFPNFERPSDLDGVIFDSMSNPGWQSNLKTKLAKAGFAIPKSI